MVADGKALSDFIRTRASINAKQLDGKYDCHNLETLPSYDRGVIKDPQEIASLFLARHKNSKASVRVAPEPPNKDMVRATLVMNISQIRGLKTWF